MRSQSEAVLSHDARTSMVASAEKAARVTAAPCGRTPRQAPLSISQTRAVPSYDKVHALAPSSDSTPAVMPSVWPAMLHRFE